MAHISVLLHEVVESLNLRLGMTVFDGTFGAGGHSRHIASSIGTSGHLISCDADASVFTEETLLALRQCTKFTPVVDNFRNADAILTALE